MRDLGDEVVGDVRLADAVEEEAGVGAVDGAESAALEVELRVAVVRKHDIGVLEVGDHLCASVFAYGPPTHDQVRVDPEVGREVVGEDLGEATLHAPVAKGTKGEREAKVRDEDVADIASLEDGRRRLEVVRALAVLLARGVQDEVERPAERLLQDHVEQDPDRGVVEEVIGLLVNGTELARELLQTGAELQLRAGLGDEDLIASHVAGSGVVLSVRDAPAVVGNEQSRVKRPSDRVVHVLRLGEALVTALVAEQSERRSRERTR